jgi:hypothetical protein
LHLLLDQFKYLRRHEGPEGATHVIGDIRQRKETREGEQEQNRRKQGEEKVVRQLSGKTENIVVHHLSPRATREFRPRKGSDVEHPSAECKC